MELFIILCVIAIIVPVYMIISTFNNPCIWFYTTFRGYKKIKVTEDPAYGGKETLTITKDGKEAPVFPELGGIGTYTLNNGRARFSQLDFWHASYVYV